MSMFIFFQSLLEYFILYIRFVIEIIELLCDCLAIVQRVHILGSFLWRPLSLSLIIRSSQ